MADKILKEDASGGIQLEDGSGVLLIERYIELVTADGMSTTDTTPTLEFTGTDPNADDVSYRIQIDRTSTFRGTLLTAASLDSYVGDDTYNQQLYSGGDQRGGQSFRAKYTAVLKSVTFKMYKSGAPPSTFVAEVWKLAGPYLNTLPNDGPLATSGVLLASDLTTTPTATQLDFSGANQIVLTADELYAVVIAYNSGSVSNRILFAADQTQKSHYGSMVYMNTSGVWNSWGASVDASFDLKADYAAPLLDKASAVDAGFVNTVNGGDSDPFTSGEKASYTVQAGNALATTVPADVAFRGTPQSATNGAGSSVAISKPAGVVEGDLILVSCITYGNLNNPPTIGPPPAGFALLPGTAIGVSGTDGTHHNCRGAVFYKIADGTEGSTFTVTHLNDHGDNAIDGDCTVLSGVDRDNPFHLNALTAVAQTGNPTTTDLGSTTVDKAWHFLYFKSWDAENGGAITGYTRDLFYGSGSSSVYHKVITTAGATGAKNDTPSSSGWVAIAFAVNPMTPGLYYWRARAWDPAGSVLWSSWSDIRDFLVTVASGTLYFDTETGALSFAGTLSRSSKRAITGILSFTGAMVKTASRAFTGGLSFTGAVLKRASKIVTGGLSFSGALVSSHVVNAILTGGLSFAGALFLRTSKTLTGGLSFAGNLIKETRRAFTGGLSFSGATIRSTSRALAGALSFSGALLNRAIKTLTGALSFSGNVTMIKSFTKLMTGALSFTGAMTKAVNRTITGTLSFTGAMLKQSVRALTGVLSFSGAFVKRAGKVLVGVLSFAGVTTTIKSFTSALSGALSFSGALQRAMFKPFAGVLSFSGALTRLTSRIFAGALSFAGNLLKRTSRALSGVLSFSGNVAKMSSRAFAGVLSFSGAFVRLPQKALQGAVGFAGALIRLTKKNLTAALSFSGQISKFTSRALAGVLSFAGAFVASLQNKVKDMTGTLSFAGSLTRGQFKVFAASLSFVGNVTKMTSRALAGGLSFTGGLLRSSTRTFTGVLTFSGAMSRGIAKAFAGVLSFVGSLGAFRVVDWLQLRISVTGIPNLLRHAPAAVMSMVHRPRERD